MERKKTTLDSQLQDTIQRMSDMEKNYRGQIENCRKRAKNAETKLKDMIKKDRDYRSRQIAKYQKLREELSKMEDEAKAVCLP